MIKIVTDSTSMIDKRDAKKYDVKIVPLNIQINDKHYLDGVNVDGSMANYANLHYKNIPKSSTPSIGRFINTFKALTKNGNSVLCLTIGSKFSGTYNVARQASQLVNSKIAVMDSKTVDQSLRYMVIKASKMASSGKYTINQIVRRLEVIRSHSQLFMGVSTLKNLKTNGRIGMVAGFLTSLLDLHIVISLDHNQKMHIIQKGRGKRTFIKWMKKEMIKLTSIDDFSYIGISYTGSRVFPELLKNHLKRLCSNNKIILRKTSATVTCHTGNNAFALMFCTK